MAEALARPPDPNSMRYSQLQADMLPRTLRKICDGALSAEQLKEQTETILAKAKTVCALQKAVADFARAYAK